MARTPSRGLIWLQVAKRRENNIPYFTTTSSLDMIMMQVCLKFGQVRLTLNLWINFGSRDPG